jgi:hypothetical protein
MIEKKLVSSTPLDRYVLGVAVFAVISASLLIFLGRW